MEVGTKDILIVDAFVAVFLIITISIDDLAQRFFIVREEGAPLVVFKAVVGFIKLFVINLDVTDIAILDLVESVVSHDAQSFDSTARSLDIVLAKKLETAADS